METSIPQAVANEADRWKCQMCLLYNAPDKSDCIACSTPRTNDHVELPGPTNETMPGHSGLFNPSQWGPLTSKSPVLGLPEAAADGVFSASANLVPSGWDASEVSSWRPQQLFADTSTTFKPVMATFTASETGFTPSLSQGLTDPSPSGFTSECDEEKDTNKQRDSNSSKRSTAVSKNPMERPGFASGTSSPLTDEPAAMTTENLEEPVHLAFSQKRSGDLTNDVVKRQRKSADSSLSTPQMISSVPRGNFDASSSARKVPQYFSQPTHVSGGHRQRGTPVSRSAPAPRPIDDSPDFQINTPLKTNDTMDSGSDLHISPSLSSEQSQTTHSKPSSEGFTGLPLTCGAGLDGHSLMEPELKQKGARFSFGVSLGGVVEGLTPDSRAPCRTTPTFGSSAAHDRNRTSEVFEAFKDGGKEVAEADIGMELTRNTSGSPSPLIIPEAEVKHRPDSSDEGDAVGTVYTWGSCDCDQLAVADKDLTDMLAAPTPLQVMKLRKQKVVSVACGALHSAALLEDGTVATWGCNDDGPLGRDTTFPDGKSERMPARVVGLPDDDPVVGLSCGDSHTATVTESGECYIWGSYKDSGGYIGFPDFDNGCRTVQGFKMLKPTKVEGLFGRCIKVASGENHTVVLCLPAVADSQVQIEPADTETLLAKLSPVIFAFGSGEFGQLLRAPLPDFGTDKTPYLYPQPSTVTALGVSKGIITNVFCGRSSTFVETRTLMDEVSYQWKTQYLAVGRDFCGELGIGKAVECVHVPEEIHDFKGMEILDISGCQFASIALDDGGNVYTFGKKDNLGHSFESNQTTPQMLKSIKGMKCIGTGGDTMFAVTSSGVLLSWGEGQMFQLGDGNEYLQPVTFPTIVQPSTLAHSSVLSVTGGSQHSVALVFNGEYYNRKTQSEGAPNLVEDIQLRHGSESLLFPFPRGKNFGKAVLNHIFEISSQKIETDDIIGLREKRKRLLTVDDEGGASSPVSKRSKAEPLSAKAVALKESHHDTTMLTTSPAAAQTPLKSVRQEELQEERTLSPESNKAEMEVHESVEAQAEDLVSQRRTPKSRLRQQNSTSGLHGVDDTQMKQGNKAGSVSRRRGNKITPVLDSATRIKSIKTTPGKVEFSPLSLKKTPKSAPVQHLAINSSECSLLGEKADEDTSMTDDNSNEYSTIVELEDHNGQRMEQEEENNNEIHPSEDGAAMGKMQKAAAGRQPKAIDTQVNAPAPKSERAIEKKRSAAGKRKISRSSSKEIEPQARNAGRGRKAKLDSGAVGVLSVQQTTSKIKTSDNEQPEIKRTARQAILDIKKAAAQANAESIKNSVSKNTRGARNYSREKQTDLPLSHQRDSKASKRKTEEDSAPAVAGKSKQKESEPKKPPMRGRKPESDKSERAPNKAKTKSDRPEESSASDGNQTHKNKRGRKPRKDTSQGDDDIGKHALGIAKGKTVSVKAKPKSNTDASEEKILTKPPVARASRQSRRRKQGEEGSSDDKSVSSNDKKARGRSRSNNKAAPRSMSKAAPAKAGQSPKRRANSTRKK